MCWVALRSENKHHNRLIISTSSRHVTCVSRISRSCSQIAVSSSFSQTHTQEYSPYNPFCACFRFYTDDLRIFLIISRGKTMRFWQKQSALLTGTNADRSSSVGKYRGNAACSTMRQLTTLRCGHSTCDVISWSADQGRVATKPITPDSSMRLYNKASR